MALPFFVSLDKLAQGHPYHLSTLRFGGLCLDPGVQFIHQLLADADVDVSGVFCLCHVNLRKTMLRVLQGNYLGVTSILLFPHLLDTAERDCPDPIVQHPCIWIHPHE
jgi:hypothetical protein